MKTDKNVCSICGDPNWPDGNHNAEPINSGRCCGICNTTVVVPARIARITQGRDPREVVKE